jgi:hypothetical protein
VIPVAIAVDTQSPLVYDPRFMEFDQWACLMCEQYAAQQLSIPTGDTDWKAWAAGLMGIDVFVNQAIPSPYNFSEWSDWASALVNVMNGGR